jgi:hypothetical protein
MYHVSANHNNSAPTTLTAYFGYDKSIQSHDRNYYDDAAWEAIIKAQLDAGLPVYYSGGREGSRHVFVVDGYDNTGKFHVNWGWSGGYNEYYSLNALKPREGRDYDRNHRAVINIKPDAGSTGSNEFRLSNFAVNKTSVSQNELFTVTATISSRSFFTGGQAGLVLVNNNGTIEEVVGVINYNPMNIDVMRNSTINTFVPPDVKPGQYSLRIVTRPEGGNWKIITVSAFRNDVPNSFPFTVTAETGTPGGGYGMALTAFTASKTTVSRNESFTVSNQSRNMGTERYPGGDVGAVLVNDNGSIAAFVGTRTAGELAVGSTGSLRDMNCTVPNTVAPG